MRRWTEARDDGRDWAQNGFDDLKSGSHWDPGSEAAYAHMKDPNRGQGIPVNYKDFYEDVEPVFRNVRPSSQEFKDDYTQNVLHELF